MTKGDAVQLALLPGVEFSEKFFSGCVTGTLCILLCDLLGINDINGLNRKNTYLENRGSMVGFRLRSSEPHKVKRKVGTPLVTAPINISFCGLPSAWRFWYSLDAVGRHRKE